MQAQHSSAVRDTGKPCRPTWTLSRSRSSYSSVLGSEVRLTQSRKEYRYKYTSSSRENSHREEKRLPILSAEAGRPKNPFDFMLPHSEYIILYRYKTETIYVKNGDHKTETIKWICEKQRLHKRDFARIIHHGSHAFVHHKQNQLQRARDRDAHDQAETSARNQEEISVRSARQTHSQASKIRSTDALEIRQKQAEIARDRCARNQA